MFRKILAILSDSRSILFNQKAVFYETCFNNTYAKITLGFKKQPWNYKIPGELITSQLGSSDIPDYSLSYDNTLIISKLKKTIFHNHLEDLRALL